MVVTEDPTSQWLRGVLDLCLMAVLAHEPLYGYEMTRHLTSAGLSTVADGSIYPALSRLEKAGLIESFTQAGSGGPPRKYYRLTPSGRTTLVNRSQEWRTFSNSIESVLKNGMDGVSHG